MNEATLQCKPEYLILEIKGNDRIPICIVSFTGFDFSLSNENVFITDEKKIVFVLKR